MGKSDDEVRVKLRADVMRFAVGCNAAQADEVLDLIVVGWGFRDCAQLADVLPMIEIPGHRTQNAALFWLHSTVVITNARPAGRRLIRKAAEAAAAIDRERAACSN
jgi:hypothetical protein